MPDLVLAAHMAPLSILAQGGKESKENIATPVFRCWSLGGVGVELFGGVITISVHGHPGGADADYVHHKTSPERY